MRAAGYRNHRLAAPVTTASGRYPVAAETFGYLVPRPACCEFGADAAHYRCFRLVDHQLGSAVVAYSPAIAVVPASVGASFGGELGAHRGGPELDSFGLLGVNDCEYPPE
jgi:hypothetical protein